MSLTGEHKALVFLGVVAVFGAVVRVLRANHGDASPVSQPVLDQQIGKADSSARAGRHPASSRSRSAARPRRASKHPDSAPQTSGPQPPTVIGPLDRAGYLFGKVDLDAATAAQIESLPGIGPTLARRIVADRAAHGPFVDKVGLQRVGGLGPSVRRRLDTLVTFSGTLRPLSAGPESISTRSSRRRRPKG